MTWFSEKKEEQPEFLTPSFKLKGGRLKQLLNPMDEEETIKSGEEDVIVNSGQGYLTIWHVENKYFPLSSSPPPKKTGYINIYFQSPLYITYLLILNVLLHLYMYIHTVYGTANDIVIIFTGWALPLFLFHVFQDNFRGFHDQ